VKKGERRVFSDFLPAVREAEKTGRAVGGGGYLY
jgi:hypothetical protein